MPRSDLLAEIRREGYTLGAIWRFLRVSVARVSRGLPEHPELVRPIAATAIGLFVLQFVGAILFSVHLGRGTGVTYLVASSLMLLFVSFWVLVHVGILLGSREAQLVIRMPIPIAITMLRFVSIPAILILIHEERWAAVVWLFAASAFTDVLDGVLARALRVETRVGALLDPMTDVAFNFTIFIALQEAGVVPWWVTALVLLRYSLLVGGTVYLYLFHGPVRIQPTFFGKLTGFLTSVLLGILLLGMTWWSEAMRHRLADLFAVGLGAMAVATIIQLVFIGVTNRIEAKALIETTEAEPRPAKVVGEIRGPR